MKLKSIMLGSAAALVAVSGARAADAVVIPEPEVVEYVRVCDAAGAGYYYIPGSEVCLKISGYVQYQMNFGTGVNGWDKEYEARLQFDSWTDTAYGPLATRIRLTGANQAHTNQGGPTTPLIVDRAYFDLAGLRIGIDASAFDFDIAGDADSFGAGSVSGTVRYTADLGGTSVFLSLEEDAGNGPANNWVPNVVVGLTGSVGDFGYTAAVAFDEYTGASGRSEWHAKAVANYMGFHIGGAYSSGPSSTEAYATGGTFELAASYVAELGDFTLTPAVAYTWDTNYAAGAGSPNSWTLALTAAYAITETLGVDGRIVYTDPTGPGNNTWGARIRFKSSF